MKERFGAIVLAKHPPVALEPRVAAAAILTREAKGLGALPVLRSALGDVRCEPVDDPRRTSHRTGRPRRFFLAFRSSFFALLVIGGAFRSIFRAVHHQRDMLPEFFRMVGHRRSIYLEFFRGDGGPRGGPISHQLTFCSFFSVLEGPPNHR